MADTSSIPSRNPANDDTLAGMLAEMLPKFLASVDDMLPCIVIVYDKNKNRIKVRPLIQVLTTNNKLVTRAEVQSIPVFQLGGGGYMLAFNNIKKGDLGWIKATDRDMSLFLQSYRDAPPNTRRFHKFEDALFFPDIMRDYDIVDGEHVVLQSINGKTKIALKDNSIDITSNETGGTVNILVADNVNIGPKVNLGTSGPAIARNGDKIQVDVAIGDISSIALSGPSAGSNTSALTLEGTIIEGSTNHTAD